MAAYHRVDGLVTCGLTSCTQGSAPGAQRSATSMGELDLSRWGSGTIMSCVCLSVCPSVTLRSGIDMADGIINESAPHDTRVIAVF